MNVNPNPVLQRMALDIFPRIVELGMYCHLEIPASGASDMLRILRTRTDGRIDLHCPKCGASSTFLFAPSPLGFSDIIDGAGRNWVEDFELRFNCARNKEHPAQFYFRTEIGVATGESLPKVRLLKVGQYPSIMDIESGKLRLQKEGVPRHIASELFQARACRAHGFHVAACTHLRRIFEMIILEARAEYMAKHGLTHWEAFDVARTDERIKMLRGDLPDFLVENVAMYSLLSKGIHELRDDECKKELEILIPAIDLVIEDRALKVQQAKQREDVRRMLAQAVDRHKPTK